MRLCAGMKELSRSVRPGASATDSSSRSVSARSAWSSSDRHIAASMGEQLALFWSEWTDNDEGDDGDPGPLGPTGQQHADSTWVQRTVMMKAQVAAVVPVTWALACGAGEGNRTPTVSLGS